ncbi:MAG TPA: hypothetical protein VFT66_15805 [Roseiflexaceae bacterium]|nr:hypothetical protein [Roseiflexaceae bacterium]
MTIDTTETRLATTFTEQLAELGDIPGGGALEPGHINWLHGSKASGVRSPGVFYVKASELSETPEGPWQPDARFDDERGYSAPLLHVAFIGWRSQWFVSDRDAGTFQWLPEYQGGIGAKKSTEFLCLVEGISDPMVISASGMHKEKPLVEIIKTYERGLLKQASRMAKRSLPRWAFWLPIQNQLTPDGKTMYIDATDGSGKSYGSVVTPPVLSLPENPVNALYVGNELLRYGAQIREDYALWFKTKRGSDVQEGEYYVEETKALPAPKNAVHAYDPDEDFPTDDGLL